MTDLAQLSDQEVNQRVAEAMGLPLFYRKSANSWACFADLSKTERAASFASGWRKAEWSDLPTDAEVWTPDFLYDWQAFGRLWEWLRDKSTFQPSMTPSGAIIFERDAGVFEYRDYDNPCRALALAFLQAVGT